ncbi:hypothetical protein PR202_ga28830 [Eleusine coracana subsp. coracana]|uniref:Ubiquitin-like protease family profile domain-containing protein n=1 Tax=Eleusine coracana subsp. coracana TaxID=191504 RepID=A0AAV5DJJ1_ELECO|nr:hypothetical protein PR202_ga28830 [Eleusine coracana subsp. coracana]
MAGHTDGTWEQANGGWCRLTMVAVPYSSDGPGGRAFGGFACTLLLHSKCHSGFQIYTPAPASLNEPLCPRTSPPRRQSAPISIPRHHEQRRPRSAVASAAATALKRAPPRLAAAAASSAPATPSPFRSFGLSDRASQPTPQAPQTPLCHEASSSARSRRRRGRRLGPNHFSPVRSFGLRVALAAGPRRRKRRLVDVPPAVLNPPCRRRHGGLLRRVRYFPGLRPLALRILLATGAAAPRRRRKPALVDMGSFFSQLLEKITSHDGLEEDQRGQVQVERMEPEAEKGDVMRRGPGDWSEPAFDLFEIFEPLTDKEELEVNAALHDTSLSEIFEPLTDKEEIEVDAVLHDTSHSNEIIVMHEPSNIEVTKEKLQCLRPRGWLNDEVINLYIELLQERAEREPTRFLKCHFFNTFFYKKIFVPVHRGAHWCLAVINVKDKTFQYLDSLGGMGHDVLRVLARYIMDELKDKNNIEIDISSWLEVSDNLPLQQNGWDCGMFMLKYIDFQSRGFQPFFSQAFLGSDILLVAGEGTKNSFSRMYDLCSLLDVILVVGT